MFDFNENIMILLKQHMSREERKQANFILFQTIELAVAKVIVGNGNVASDRVLIRSLSRSHVITQHVQVVFICIVQCMTTKKVRLFH